MPPEQAVHVRSHRWCPRHDAPVSIAPLSPSPEYLRSDDLQSAHATRRARRQPGTLIALLLVEPDPLPSALCACALCACAFFFTPIPRSDK